MVATRLFTLFLAATAVFAKIDPDTIVSCAKGRSQGRMYPDPDDCRKFIRCVSRKPVSFTCPPNTAFDPDTQVCAWRVGKNGCGGKLAPTTWVGMIDNLINDISQKGDIQSNRPQEKSPSSIGWENPQKKFDQGDASKQPQKYANLEKSSRELVEEEEKKTAATTTTQSLNVKPSKTVQRKSGYVPSHKPTRTSSTAVGDRKENGNSKYRRVQEAIKSDLKIKTKAESRTALNVSETTNTIQNVTVSFANSTKNVTGNLNATRTSSGVREKVAANKLSSMRSSGKSFKSVSAAAVRAVEKDKVDVKSEAYMGNLKESANDTSSNVTRQSVNVTSSTVVEAKNASDTMKNKTAMNVTSIEKVDSAIAKLNGSKSFERRNVSEFSHPLNANNTATSSDSSSLDATFTSLNSTHQSPGQSPADLTTTTTSSVSASNSARDTPNSPSVQRKSKQSSFRNAMMKPTQMTVYMTKSAQPKKYAGSPRVDFSPVPQPYRAVVMEQRSSKYSRLQDDVSSTVEPSSHNQVSELNQTAPTTNVVSKTVVATSSGMDMSRLAALKDILKYMTGKIVDRSAYQDKDGDRLKSKRWYENGAAENKAESMRAEGEAASESNRSRASAEDNVVDQYVAPEDSSSDEENTYDFAHETQQSRNQSSVVPQLSSVAAVADSSANSTNDNNNSTAAPQAEVKVESENVGQRNLSLMASTYMVKGLTREFACPKPNGHYADPRDCSVYYHCAVGIAYRRDCMTGQVFLPEAASCVSANLAPPCIQAFSNKIQMDKEFANSVCVDPNGMYRDTFSCSHYFECTNGWPIRRKCMFGTVFDEARGRCTWSRFVPGCEGEFSGDADKGSSDMKESFDCPRDGFFRDQDDCSVYYLCAAGEALRMTCEQGTSFDVNLNMCVWSYLVDGCEDRNNNLVVAGDKGNNPRHTSEEQRWNDFSCPEENGVFPDPEDCGTYYTCMDDVAKRLQCPFGTGYDDITSLCIDARQVPRCASPRKSEESSNYVQQPFVCPKHHGLHRFNCNTKHHSNYNTKRHSNYNTKHHSNYNNKHHSNYNTKHHSNYNTKHHSNYNTKHHTKHHSNYNTKHHSNYNNKHHSNYNTKHHSNYNTKHHSNYNTKHHSNYNTKHHSNYNTKHHSNYNTKHHSNYNTKHHSNYNTKHHSNYNTKHHSKLQHQTPLKLQQQTPLKLQHQTPLKLQHQTPLKLQHQTPTQTTTPNTIQTTTPNTIQTTTPNTTQTTTPNTIQTTTPNTIQTTTPNTTQTTTPNTTQTTTPNTIQTTTTNTIQTTTPNTTQTTTPNTTQTTTPNTIQTTTPNTTQTTTPNTTQTTTPNTTQTTTPNTTPNTTQTTTPNTTQTTTTNTTQTTTPNTTQTTTPNTTQTTTPNTIQTTTPNIIQTTTPNTTQTTTPNTTQTTTTNTTQTTTPNTIQTTTPNTTQTTTPNTTQTTTPNTTQTTTTNTTQTTTPNTTQATTPNTTQTTTPNTTQTTTPNTIQTTTPNTTQTTTPNTIQTTTPNTIQTTTPNTSSVADI
ncbi:hypothetical protein Btru_038813 [Bulinus truncatus]|nr:hypothetical protein Btru_038813 [Bulinus truncatus]